MVPLFQPNKSDLMAGVALSDPSRKTLFSPASAICSVCLEELTGRVRLTQFDAVASINPELARSTLEAQSLGN